MDWNLTENYGRTVTYPSSSSAYYTAVPVGNLGNKSSYVEIIDSTPFPTSEIWLFFRGETDYDYKSYVMDVAIGAAGSEVIVLPNLFFYTGYVLDGLYCLPFYVPEGSRVSVRGTTYSSGHEVYTNIMLWEQGSRYGQCDTLSVCKDYGSNIYVDYFGTTFTHANDDEWGSWQLLAPVTHFTSKAIMSPLYSNYPHDTIVQIGVGLPGYEQPVLSLMCNEDYYTMQQLNCPTPIFPISIKEGETVSIRCKGLTGYSGTFSGRVYILK